MKITFIILAAILLSSLILISPSTALTNENDEVMLERALPGDGDLVMKVNSFVKTDVNLNSKSHFILCRGVV